MHLSKREVSSNIDTYTLDSPSGPFLSRHVTIFFIAEFLQLIWPATDRPLSVLAARTEVPVVFRSLNVRLSRLSAEQKALSRARVMPQRSTIY